MVPEGSMAPMANLVILAQMGETQLPVRLLSEIPLTPILSLRAETAAKAAGVGMEAQEETEEEAAMAAKAARVELEDLVRRAMGFFFLRPLGETVVLGAMEAIRDREGTVAMAQSAVMVAMVAMGARQLQLPIPVLWLVRLRAAVREAREGRRV